MKNKIKTYYFLFLLVFITSCHTIDIYNQRAYEQATEVKAEALFVMSFATDSSVHYAKEIRQLKLNSLKALEFAKGRPKNEESIKQWEIMTDPERNMLFGFLKRWEDEGVLGAAFIENAKIEVAKGFDEIIGLESGKRKTDTN